MKELIERVIRFTLYFNEIEGYRASVIVDKTHVVFLLVNYGQVLIDNTIDKIGTKSKEYTVKELSNLCRELQHRKSVLSEAELVE